MSHAPPLRRAAGPGAALLGMGLVLALMVWVQDELNPDWLGYAAIYQDAGAWLADQGRDPLFLLLMGTMSTLFGPDGYESFRLVLAAYFAVFTFLLLRGRHVPADGQSHRWPLLLLGLLPFVAPRFTIQIREGLALTLVLVGLALLNRRTPPAAAGPGGGSASVLPTVVLFAAGMALHSGTVVLVLALFAGLAVRHVCAGSVRLELWLLLSLGLLTVSGTAVLSTLSLGTPAGRALVDDWYGLLADEEVSVSAAKWGYWGLYGLGVLTLAGRVRVLYQRGRLPAELRPVLGMVALVMLPAIYVTALLLLGAGMPAIVVSGAARVMNMLLSVSLLVLSLRGELNLRLGLFCLLVLIDQARVIVESVLGAGASRGIVTPADSPPMAVATLMCVYARDDPAAFLAAVRSVLDQDLPAGVVSRVYLGVDGPLSPALAGAVTAVEPELFLVHRSAQNLGLARMLNTLIARLQGEDLVFRMDADDVSLPLRYRAQIGYLLAHPDIDILGTAITERDEASGHTRVVRYAAGPAEALARMHWRVPVAHPTVCMRARVLALAGGYPVKGTNEDVAMWFLCASLGLRFDNLPEPLLVYRVAPDFWRRRGMRKALSELLCYLRGILRLRGLFTLAYAAPVLRFGLRLMPTIVSRWAYNLPWRRGGSIEPPTAG